MNQDFDLPNWDRIRECLSDTLREGLAELCRLIGIPFDQWYLNHGLALVYRNAAVLILLYKFRDDEGLTYHAAGERACLELNLNWESERKRIRKWRGRSYQPAQSSGLSFTSSPSQAVYVEIGTPKDER